MKLTQVAVQLYTLREHLQTPEAFAQTLERVARMGYRAVQVSGPRPLPPKDIARLCADNGLTLCATHEDPEVILAEPERVVDTLREFGCLHTAYPIPKGIDLNSPEALSTLIRQLDHAGAVLAAAGQFLSYHNHKHEFRRTGGEVVLERIYRETKPRHLLAELDTYWVQVGGGNPVSWCRKMQGRMPLLHLKDYRINAQNEVEFAEIGHGNLEFRDIIREADAGGCEWFIVEQDRCPGDPFTSLQMSFDYIRTYLAS